MSKTTVDVRWKYVSIVLMGFLATAFVAPSAYGQNSNSPLGAIQAIVEDIQIKVTDIQNSILPAIQANTDKIPGIEAKLDDVQSAVDGQGGHDNLDVAVSSRASQDSVDGIQSDIDANLDTNIGSRASQVSIDNLQATANNIDTKVTDIQALVNALDSASSSDVEQIMQLLQAIKCNTPPGAYVDLSGCDFSNRNYFGADFSNVNLSGANLSFANLQLANLQNANLQGANLHLAAGRAANLAGANLSGADLSNSGFIGANFSGANLTNANLQSTLLINANLSGANLSGAKLFDTQFAGAITDGCIGCP